MSKRLQVVLDDAEYKEIQRLAKGQRMTLSEWVRHVLRSARLRQPHGDASRKLEVVRAAAQHDFPTADIDKLLGDIERGYLGGETA
ncbi:MAG: antitoxin [Candidatus Latescibacterota bacterium]|nr:MAG: antitoxin [Candidatus Latescibacterota bacterium]